MTVPWQIKDLFRKLLRKDPPVIHPSLPDNHLPQPKEIHMPPLPRGKTRMAQVKLPTNKRKGR